jgi:hypothetical protein
LVVQPRTASKEEPEDTEHLFGCLIAVATARFHFDIGDEGMKNTFGVAIGDS